MDPAIEDVEVEESLAFSDGAGARIALTVVDGVGVDLASVGGCRDWPTINGVGALLPGVASDPLVEVAKLEVRLADVDT